ncbi:General secretion pathway protein K [Pseudoalteromonas luteoviolacea B = ATCC 29581]|nr:General secretion pathway protein K [Pseudoalteromonas luteoviolacea B = ATCC 29581]
MVKQTGAALVIVLFIVALAATIAADMAVNLMVQVQKTTNIQQHQQSKWYAYAAEELAKKVLLEVKKEKGDVIHLGQVWAQEPEPYPVDNGYLKVGLNDLHACLNLNALAQAPSNDDKNSTQGKNPAHRALLYLLQNIEELGNEESEETLADSVYDWIDADSITYRSGAEEDEYMSNRMPYLTANNLLASVSELRVIKGFNPLVMEKLLPYVCVIPGYSELKININTLEAEHAMLLSAVIPELSVSSAEAAISARPEQGYEKVTDFIEELKKQGAKDLNKVDELLTVNSEHFQLVAQAFFNERRFSMTSTLVVKDSQVIVLARKFGGVQ